MVQLVKYWHTNLGTQVCILSAHCSKQGVGVRNCNPGTEDADPGGSVTFWPGRLDRVTRFGFSERPCLSKDSGECCVRRLPYTVVSTCVCRHTYADV